MLQMQDWMYHTAPCRKENNNIFVDDLKEEDRRVVPNPVCTFEEAFQAYPGIMENIVRVGFLKPTPIQVPHSFSNCLFCTGFFQCEKIVYVRHILAHIQCLHFGDMLESLLPTQYIKSLGTQSCSCFSTMSPGHHSHCQAGPVVLLDLSRTWPLLNYGER